MNQHPQRFGKYELVEILGEGGMARVYRAVRAGPMGFRKEVAIKQILPHVAREEKLIRALINEARLGGYLRHRNVVEVYEFDQIDDVFYIAMEFVHGYTLDEALARVPTQGLLPPRVAVQIALQICAGLEYAHNAVDEDGRPMNLVHRDLKPANVMLELDGVVKIMDFGIARAETNLFKTSTANVTKGTPVYMSPEQVKGEPLDRRSDLFSLASVLSQLITGEMTFQHTQLYHVLQRVAHADVGETIRSVEARVPVVAPVLQRAFHKDPDDRYPSAAAMGRALTAVYDQLPGTETLGPWLASWFPRQDTDPVGLHGPGVATALPTGAPNLAAPQTTMSGAAAGHAPAGTDGPTARYAGAAPGAQPGPSGPHPAHPSAPGAVTPPPTTPPQGVAPAPPAAAYPQAPPSGGYPQAPPSAGYAQAPPSGGYPVAGPSGPYPQAAPSSAYPAAGPAAYPTGATAPGPTPAPHVATRSPRRWGLWLVVLGLLGVLGLCLVVIAVLAYTTFVRDGDPGNTLPAIVERTTAPPALPAGPNSGGTGDRSTAPTDPGPRPTGGDALATSGGAETAGPRDAGPAADPRPADDGSPDAGRDAVADGADTPADGDPADGPDGTAAAPDEPPPDTPPDPEAVRAPGRTGPGRALARPGSLLPPASAAQGKRQETDAAVPARITKGLESDDPDKRANAAEDLEDCQGSAATALIEELVKRDADPEVRKQALRAGKKRKTAADVRIAVWALLRDPDASIRAEAARVLEVYEDAASLRPLCRALLDDSSAAVRRAAASTLEDIGDASCVPALLHQLERESDDGVIKAIEDALDELDDG